MKKVKVHIVRHGQTIFNHQDIVQGWGDSFLTPDGIIGVQNLGRYWKNEGEVFDVAYASDSGRTLQTARVLLDAMEEENLVVQPMPDFREYNFGYFEGGTNPAAFRAIFEHMGFDPETTERTNEHFVDYLNAIAEMDAKKRGDMRNAYLSEPYELYAFRLMNGLETVIDEAFENDKKSILIVSHGLSIQTMYTELFLQDKVTTFKSMPNAGVTSFYAYEDGTCEEIHYAKALGEK